MISLKSIKEALSGFCIDVGEIDVAADALSAQLESLNDIEVKGRENIDTLLGCMLAIEAIIGETKNG